jgi:uncharacterized protein (TIGR02996 family)
MNIQAALLEAIIAHPDDDLPRLALADWLEEHGRPGPAELIRTQLALAGRPEDDERRPVLLGREAYLLARHSKELGRPLKHLALRWEFRRGCVEEVKLPAGRFLRKAAELFRAAPLRHLHLSVPRAHIDALAACPHLAGLAELTLSGDPQPRPGRGWLGGLLRAPQLQGLRALRLRGGPLWPEDVAAIGAIPTLEALELRDCQAMEQLFGLPRLRRLSLSGWFGSVDWPALVRRLEVLELRHCPGDPSNVLWRLVSGALNTPLRGLLLEGVAGALGRAPLLRSGALDLLHTLTLRACALGPQDAELIATRGPARLVHLDLGGNPLGSQGVAALAGSTHLTRLTHLGLTKVGGLGAAAACIGPLFTTPHLPRLAALDLSRDDLDASDARALVASPLPERLYRLDLRHNHLGDAGAFALLEADWPRLAWLDVRDNGLSAAAKDALRSRFGYSVHY